MKLVLKYNFQPKIIILGVLVSTRHVTNRDVPHVCNKNANVLNYFWTKLEHSGYSVDPCKKSHSNKQTYRHTKTKKRATTLQFYSRNFTIDTSDLLMNFLLEHKNVLGFLYTSVQHCTFYCFFKCFGVYFLT